MQAQYSDDQVSYIATRVDGAPEQSLSICHVLFTVVFSFLASLRPADQGLVALLLNKVCTLINISTLTALLLNAGLFKQISEICGHKMSADVIFG